MCIKRMVLVLCFLILLVMIVVPGMAVIDQKQAVKIITQQLAKVHQDYDIKVIHCDNHLMAATAAFSYRYGKLYIFDINGIAPKQLFSADIGGEPDVQVMAAVKPISSDPIICVTGSGGGTGLLIKTRYLFACMSGVWKKIWSAEVFSSQAENPGHPDISYESVTTVRLINFEDSGKNARGPLYIDCTTIDKDIRESNNRILKQVTKHNYYCWNTTKKIFVVTKIPPSVKTKHVQSRTQLMEKLKLIASKNATWRIFSSTITEYNEHLYGISIAGPPESESECIIWRYNSKTDTWDMGPADMGYSEDDTAAVSERQLKRFSNDWNIPVKVMKKWIDDAWRIFDKRKD